MKRMAVLAVLCLLPVAGAEDSGTMVIAATLTAIHNPTSYETDIATRDRFVRLLGRSSDLCSDISTRQATAEIWIVMWK